MKLACSSATFARAFARVEFSQLEWLDMCANELEVDGVVFAAAHFPRLDSEYLAQLKKTAADLGLTVAAVAIGDIAATDAAGWLEVATALGAPLLVAHAAPASSEAAAWGRFTASLKARAGDAKRANVTLGLRDVPETMCADVADLVRASKDVDSAWLRYALDARALRSDAATPGTLAKTVIAFHAIDDLEHFATENDDAAAALVRGLARFRGFVTLDASHGDATPRDAFHRALERFAALRATHATAASARS